VRLRNYRIFETDNGRLSIVEIAQCTVLNIQHPMIEGMGFMGEIQVFQKQGTNPKKRE